jgi:sugar lactone lactonase YvrE
MRLRLFLAVVLCLFAFAGAGHAADTRLARASYPEGALWHKGRLFHAEMGRDAVMVSDLSDVRVFWTRRGCGPVSIAPYARDEFIVLCHLAHLIVRVSADGQTREVIDRDSAGVPFVYPNASAADGLGGVYFSSSGTFAPEAPATGAVLYLDASGQLARIAEGIHYANGVAVDRVRNRLLVSAHLDRRILAYPLKAPGRLGAPRVFFDFARNSIDHRYALAGPDGLEITPAGDVLVAEYGEGRLHRIAADGRYLGELGGFAPFVTDMALLPDGRGAVTASFRNDIPDLPGEVVLRDRFLERFARPPSP